MLLHLTRIVGFLATIGVWRLIQQAALPWFAVYGIVIGSVVVVFPITWLGRKLIDASATIQRVVWITSFVHIALMILLGASIIEAITLFQEWRGITIPLPAGFGRVLLYLTGTCLALTVVNLAISGLGAPFAIAFSKRLASRWMYRWTRNPMVLCTLATLASVGLYLQSLAFVLWVVLLVTPAWIHFLRVYEERELEIRFGTSYTDYRNATSFLWPRRPRR